MKKDNKPTSKKKSGFGERHEMSDRSYDDYQ